KKRLNLALQGGGAHGAYSWGVLDRLLEEESCEIEGISGTSAGAMNGAVLADGFMKGGAAGAKEALRQFWERVGEASFISSLNAPLTAWLQPWNLDNSYMSSFMNAFSRVFSPYAFNPFNINPLREILEAQVDFSV